MKVLRAPWFLGLVCAVLLSLLVWFLGPLVAIADFVPLADEIVRIVVIAVIFVLWGLLVLLFRMRSKRKNEKLVAEVSKGSADPTASADEAAALARRFQDALAQLKASKLGGARRSYLYQLPWYIVIGPPGAGKTTALVNSGLKFPLEGSAGKGKLQGVGGTRDCDWWFTEDAVLIDTAGRYTTQDSDKSVDTAGWKAFLGLLRRYRPRQPINGVLVAISLSDLMVADEAERKAHAQAVRQRIRELYDELKARFPIYVLFTKADLVAGFVEYFEDLDHTQRDQVWGITFPHGEDKRSEAAVAAFPEEFDLLVKRLNERVLERLQQERDVTRRVVALGFPTQVGALRQVAQGFLDEVFQPSRYAEPPLLRGVYFTSGTQEGTPVDRVMSAMAATFGLNPQRLSAQSGRGRSYFLGRLLREVIFREAGLVSVSRKAERRRRIAFAGVAAVAALVLLAGVGAWFTSYSGNEKLIASVENSIAAYKAQLEGLDLTEVKDSGLQPVLPALNTLREMPTGYAHRDEPVPTMLGLGLYQGDKLGAQAVDAYYRGLNALMLPRLLLRLEEQLARNLDKPEFLYEGLKIYLMLGGQAPINEPLVRQWIVLDWESIYPGDANKGGREALAQHLDALLERPLDQIALNGPLVEEVRARLANLPLAERAYSLIRQLPAAQRLPEWRVSEHGGPAVTRVFMRPSGKMLSEGVPGIYTYDGFHNVFLPALGDVTAQVGRDAWVLGGDPTATLSEDVAQKLRQDVLSLYLEDYAARWDGLLADLGIVPFENLQHATETLNSLGGPSSPLRLVLQGVARETTLTAAPPKPATDATTDAAAAAATAAANAAGAGTLVREADRISDLLGAADGGGPVDPPGKFIDDRFQALHDLVADGGSGSQLDQALTQVNQLYGELQRMAASPNQNELSQTGGAGGAAILDLTTTTTRLPEPVASWLAPVASGVSAIRVGGTRTRIDSLWKSDVLPLCRQALAGRYPFEAGSSDVTLADFTRLFAPGGLIDQFFKTHLLPFVDTSGGSWRNQRVDNVDLGLSSGALAQFQRADKIRNAFFPTGGSVPQVAFEVTPQDLSAAATQVLFEVDGQTMTYSHGPARAQPMQWPGQGAGQARIVFTPQQSGSTLSASGPWALFRLLDAAVVQRAAASDRFTVTFTAGGRSAAFEVRAGSVINPFALPELKAFQCPGLALAEAPGLFGKVPALGDFVSRRLPRSFVDGWDLWLQTGLTQSRAELGEHWRKAFLSAPFWRFGLSGGLCGPAPAVGVLMASVDQVGRQFPLTVAVPLADAPFAPVLPLVGGAWFAAMEEAMLTAFDTPFDLDAFDARIAAAGAPSLAHVGARETAAVEALGRGMRITLPAAADTAEAGALLAHGALAATYGRYSLWVTTGSEEQAAACLVFPGLPPPEMFAALLDGRYARAAAGASLPFEVIS